jgi:hypothetical protein
MAEHGVVPGVMGRRADRLLDGPEACARLGRESAHRDLAPLPPWTSASAFPAKLADALAPGRLRPILIAERRGGRRSCGPTDDMPAHRPRPLWMRGAA